MEENKTEETAQQQQEPERTVNVHKYEREAEARKAAESRVADLEAQIAALKADGETAKSELEAFKAKTAEDAKAWTAEREKWEADLARKDRESELLKGGCIDPESGLASLKEGETVEQLKERKPHLFKGPVKQSSMQPSDKPTDNGDALTDKMKAALGL